MDKTSLKSEIKSVFDGNMSSDEAAEKITNAIDAFVKSAKINLNPIECSVSPTSYSGSTVTKPDAGSLE